MQQILVAFDGFVPVVAVLLLLAIAAGGVSAFARGCSTAPFGLREPVIDGALTYSVLCVGYLVFTPQVPAPESIRPELGTDVSAALTASPGDVEPMLQLAGNLVLLLPLGMLVPKRIVWFDHVGKIALGGMATSALIELIQFLAISGRVASTDDIVCNTIGATVGGVLMKLPQWLSPAARAQHRTSGDNDQTVWLLIEKVEAEERERRRRARDAPHRVRPMPPRQEVFLRSAIPQPRAFAQQQAAARPRPSRHPKQLAPQRVR